MGTVPAKYFLPPAPYGTSPAQNTISPATQAAQNPQVPLLPPNFFDPGKMQQAQATNPFAGTQGGGIENMGKLFQMYAGPYR